MSYDDENSHALLPSDPALRVKSLETILTEKGLVEPAALDAIIDAYQNQIGPKNGAKVVARMWVDAIFRDEMLRNPTPLLHDMGFLGRQGEHMVFVENTDKIHNVVVCTLCSCYPWPLLGIPPGWYKSDSYRARTVRSPRDVLAEFGVEIPDEKKVRVWDSTAEIRYLVVPQRPAGTEGLDESTLASLVTRDSMIGTGFARVPSP